MADKLPGAGTPPGRMRLSDWWPAWRNRLIRKPGFQRWAASFPLTRSVARKRANAKLSRAQLFILFYMSGMIMGRSVAGTPLFTQFLVRSDAAVSTGVAALIPTWVAPANLDDLPRTFLSKAWMPFIATPRLRMSAAVRSECAMPRPATIQFTSPARTVCTTPRLSRCSISPSNR